MPEKNSKYITIKVSMYIQKDTLPTRDPVRKRTTHPLWNNLNSQLSMVLSSNFKYFVMSLTKCAIVVYQML